MKKISFVAFALTTFLTNNILTETIHKDITIADLERIFSYT